MATPTYDSLDDITFYSMLAILQAGMWLMNDLESSLRKYGFSQGRFAILLAALESKDGTVSPKSLADEMGKSKPTISRMIDRLSEDGYLEVEGDRSDGRRKHIALTPKAAALLDTVVPRYNQRLLQISSGLSDADKRTILVLLSKLRFENPALSIRLPT